jgi:hypothetical protein
MPNRYWMPTTLWSSVYLKYLPRPGSSLPRSLGSSGSGLPIISRPRSLNTPRPASQPMVPNA